MKKIILLIIVVVPVIVQAQQLIDRAGRAHFFSSAPMEDIEAVNEKALGAMDLTSGQVAVTLRMEEFIFDKSLMQEHFNENYVESEKYPKAILTGNISNFPADFIEKAKSGLNTQITGKMEIHGVARQVELPVTFTIQKGILTVHSVFTLAVADYKIEIPKMVMMNIAEEVEVTVDFKFELPEEK